METEKSVWQKSREELFRELNSSPDGLTGAEAARRLEQYGPNELQEGGKKSTLRIFLEQFADFIVISLILAAIVSAALGDVESTVVILAVITMNAILGTMQTVKAAASLDSLKQMSAPTAKVMRDGQVIQIPGREVTVGDVATITNYYSDDITATLESVANDPQNPGQGKMLVFRLTGDGVEAGANLTLSIGQRSANYDCLIPNSALRNDSNGDFVLVVVAKSTPLGNRYVATRASVTVLAKDDTKAAVTGLASASQELSGCSTISRARAAITLTSV